MPKKRSVTIAMPRPLTIISMPVDRLLLDPNNPRLASTAEAKSDFEIIKTLWTIMSVDELVLSIAENGYFQEEPLFVIPEHLGDPDTKYIVVEGNRRLAAVKILLDDDLRKKLRATDMPTISDARKDQLRQLPVSIYDTHEELWTFLSFRHINSPKQWDPFSKARYVAQVHDDYDVPLEEIARKTGDRHDTVERLYRGYKVLLQAENQGNFSREDRYRGRFSFSHLYTALDYPEFRRFLGLDPDVPMKDDSPIPRSHLNELDELMVWLYGKKSEGIEPIVVTQNPHLGMLRDIVVKPSALAALRKGYSLQTSHEISIGDERRFQEAVASAKEELQRAKGTVTTGYKGDSELYDTVLKIQDIAESIRVEMQPKLKKPVRTRS